MIYPWQQTLWQQLKNSVMHDQLSHALLFRGVAGIGKSVFVKELVRFILCEKRSTFGETECCHACHLLSTSIHPNFYEVTPEKAGHAIKIDQIRELIEFTEQSAYLGKYQCVIIHPAHQMNHFAANALLKTLEEPTQNVFIFLITEERSRLPATIVSRAMQVNMPVPAQHIALTWLKQQTKQSPADVSLSLKVNMGAPLKALAWLQSDTWKTRKLVYEALLQLHSEPLQLLHCAATLQSVEMQELFDLLLSWSLDLVKIKCGIESDIINQDYAKQLKQCAGHNALPHFDRALYRMNRLRNEFVIGTHLNKTLGIEHLLMTMTGVPVCS